MDELVILISFPVGRLPPARDDHAGSIGQRSVFDFDGCRQMQGIAEFETERGPNSGGPVEHRRCDGHLSNIGPCEEAIEDGQFCHIAEIHRLDSTLQAHEVARLCADGVGRYDLGMDIPYKRNWGEQLVTTRTLLVVR